jgi:hypothetical protein
MKTRSPFIRFYSEEDPVVRGLLTEMRTLMRRAWEVDGEDLGIIHQRIQTDRKGSRGDTRMIYMQSNQS